MRVNSPGPSAEAGCEGGPGGSGAAGEGAVGRGGGAGLGGAGGGTCNVDVCINLVNSPGSVAVFSEGGADGCGTSNICVNSPPDGARPGGGGAAAGAEGADGPKGPERAGVFGTSAGCTGSENIRVNSPPLPGGARVASDGSAVSVAALASRAPGAGAFRGGAGASAAGAGCTGSANIRVNSPELGGPEDPGGTCTLGSFAADGGAAGNGGEGFGGSAGSTGTANIRVNSPELGGPEAPGGTCTLGSIARDGGAAGSGAEGFGGPAGSTGSENIRVNSPAGSRAGGAGAGGAAARGDGPCAVTSDSGKAGIVRFGPV